MFKDASLQVNNAHQSESGPDGPEAVTVNQIGSSLPEIPPLPMPQGSGKDKSPEDMQYQHLPVRNMVSPSRELPLHHEFQVTQNLNLGPSSNFPVLSFEEAISDSTNEMDLNAEGIQPCGDETRNHYSEFSAHYSTDDNSGPFSSVTTNPGSSDYENLGVNALHYMSRSASHMSQMAEVDEPQYVTGEAWDFSDMSSPGDFYDMRANNGHAGQGWKR